MNKEKFPRRYWNDFRVDFEEELKKKLHEAERGLVPEIATNILIREIFKKWLQEIAWIVPYEKTTLSVKEIATIYNVSTRTIYRCLRKLAKDSNYTTTDTEFGRWIIVYKTIQELSWMIRKTGKYKQ
ncbi:MAG: HTH domain-containing protein [Candidatus Pacearchaeota archaeon]